MTPYLKKKIERKDLQKVLGIKKTRFFALIKRFKDDHGYFSVSYFRSIPTPHNIERYLNKYYK